MAYEPHWTLVLKGKHRCQECGEFVERAWCWFEKPALHTICWCENCVGVKLELDRQG